MAYRDTHRRFAFRRCHLVHIFLALFAGLCLMITSPPLAILAAVGAFVLLPVLGAEEG